MGRLVAKALYHVQKGVNKKVFKDIKKHSYKLQKNFETLGIDFSSTNSVQQEVPVNDGQYLAIISIQNSPDCVPKAQSLASVCEDDSLLVFCSLEQAGNNLFSINYNEKVKCKKITDKQDDHVCIQKRVSPKIKDHHLFFIRNCFYFTCSCFVRSFVFFQTQVKET